MILAFGFQMFPRPITFLPGSPYTSLVYASYDSSLKSSQAPPHKLNWGSLVFPSALLSITIIRFWFLFAPLITTIGTFYVFIFLFTICCMSSHKLHECWDHTSSFTIVFLRPSLVPGSKWCLINTCSWMNDGGLIIYSIEPLYTITSQKSFGFSVLSFNF